MQKSLEARLAASCELLHARAGGLYCRVNHGAKVQSQLTEGKEVDMNPTDQIDAAIK